MGTFLGHYRHAGYSYSGPAAAWAYKSIDTFNMFVHSPHSHTFFETAGFIATVFLFWVLRIITISKAVPYQSAQSMRHLSGTYRSM